MQRTVCLIGAGMGTRQSMTGEALQALEQAQVVFGARRMLAVAEGLDRPLICAYEADKIQDILVQHPEYQRAAVLLSGDIGFFSGAKNLKQILEPEFEVSCFCGISSLAYFAAKLGISYEDMAMASRHGRACNLVGLLLRKEHVFSLFSNGAEIRQLAAELLEYHMEQVQLAVGVNLGIFTEKESEQIYDFAPVREYLEYENTGLHVAILKNPAAKEFVAVPGIPDSDFCRGNVPMTKEEVRTVSLAKLRLMPDSIVYDIGAGTGSVSVECARIAYQGAVYSFEKNPEAAALIRKNARRFQAPNVTILIGSALELLKENKKEHKLPAPTHVFIGGSGGQLSKILDFLFEAYPAARLVLNIATLESLAEVTSYCSRHKREMQCVQVAVSASRKMGSYHLMQAQNPVFIILIHY